MHKNEEHEARTVENASVGSTPRVEGANALEPPSSSSGFLLRLLRHEVSVFFGLLEKKKRNVAAKSLSTM